jgi:hypothetical protein
VVADTAHFVALGAVVEVDADVQPVTNRTRPANAAVAHRTLRQAQIGCHSEDVTVKMWGCSRDTDAHTGRRRPSLFVTSVYAAGGRRQSVQMPGAACHKRQMPAERAYIDERVGAVTGCPFQRD